MANPVNFIELLSHGAIPQVLLGTWLVMGILIIFGALARRSLARAADPIVPDDGITLRSVAEAAVEMLDGQIEQLSAIHDYRMLVPYLGAIFVFIVTANFIGLVPGMEPPTADSDLTFALGATSFAYFIYHGFREKGLLGYARSFLGPFLPVAILMLPIELADNVFRPFSLGLRLYANMFADHTVLGMFTGLTRLVVPLAFYALGSLVCIIQAYVFMALSAAYVRLAVSHDH